MVWYSFFRSRFRALRDTLLESCQIRKEAALRGAACVLQVTRNLASGKSNRTASEGSESDGLRSFSTQVASPDL